MELLMELYTVQGIVKISGPSPDIQSFFHIRYRYYLISNLVSTQPDIRQIGDLRTVGYLVRYPAGYKIQYQYQHSANLISDPCRV